MGCLFSCVRRQTQYVTCDECNSDEIYLREIISIPMHGTRKGEAHFTCSHNHNFAMIFLDYNGQTEQQIRRYCITTSNL